MTNTSKMEIALKALVALCLAASLMLPAVAQAPALAMLDRLDRGEWELKPRDGGNSQKICLRTGRELIQLRHPGQSCQRVVVEDGAQQVTVQYTCRGQGYGRTNIRRETNSLVQIQAQGIAGTRHFQFTAEARRTGNCR